MRSVDRVRGWNGVIAVAIQKLITVALLLFVAVWIYSASDVELDDQQQIKEEVYGLLSC